ncbi:MAG: sugar transferase [Bacteroidota bacterium]
MKRTSDLMLAAVALLMLSPLLFVLGAWVGLSSKGGIFYRQERVGRYGKPFQLIKFRSMRPASDQQGLLTVGKDQRITPVGHILRKYKLDELPQLWNIIKGEMSIVGPRPEVQKYVDYYSAQQRKVLELRPGLTDYASLEYFEEARLLAASSDPEKTYINEVMPAKLALNLRYLAEQSPLTDMKIIGQTIGKILKA